LGRTSLIRFAVVAGVLLLAWWLRSITVPLMAAWLLSLVLLPLRNRLAPHTGRGLATALSLALALCLPPLLLVPSVLLDGEALASGLGDTAALARDIQGRLQELAVRFDLESLEIAREDIEGPLREVPALLARGARFVGGFVGILSSLLLIPVYTFFLLQGSPWLPRIRAELPPSWHARFDRIAPRIQEILRVFCVSRLLVAAGKGAIYFALLLLAGLPGAWTLALLGGGLSLLPVLGPLIAFAGLAVVAFASQGPAGLAWATGIYAVAEIVEGYVLLPRLVGQRLALSDFAVILSVLAGGALFGMFGLLLAVPAVAVGRVLYDEYLRPHMTSEAAGA